MPLRTAAIAIGSGALLFGALNPLTASAEDPTEPDGSDESIVSVAPEAAEAPEAAVAAPEATARPTKTVARWDWSMPSAMKDKKVWEEVTDPASPDYPDGGFYIDNPAGDGIPDNMMKKTKQSGNSGFNRYGPLPKNGKYKVVLDGSASQGPGQLTCKWDIKLSKKKTKTVKSKCKKTKKVKLPEGKYRTILTVTGKGGAQDVNNQKKNKIKVKNHLMVIMGDSYSSGEGFPPYYEPNTSGTNPSVPRFIAWDDNRCHRSRWSGMVRAALRVEEASDKSNVTLVDVACTGAQVSGGNLTANTEILGDLSGQGGILHPQKNSPTNGVDYGYAPAQINQAYAALRNGKLVADNVYFTIGGNDVLFYPLVVACGVAGASTLLNELPPEVLDLLAKQLAGFIARQYPSAGTPEQIVPKIEDAIRTSGKQNCYGAKPIWATDQTESSPSDNKALWAIIQRQLEQLEIRYNDMAKCIKPLKGKKAPGKGRQCQTYALQGGPSGQPASSPSKSKPLKVAKAKNVVQGIYPDLTSGEKGPLGGKTVQPCEWSPDYPADSISNRWAYDVAYTGATGSAVGMPDWGNGAVALPYSGANKVWLNNTYEPSITPQVPGIRGLIQQNKQKYGWSPELKMLDASRGHGGCAGDSWLFPATSAAGSSAPAPYNNPPNGSGAMHPNNQGQAAYAKYMGDVLLKRTGANKE